MIQVIGLSHKSAPIELRERLAFSPKKLTEALSMLKEYEAIDEGVIVSTCNRVELYIAGKDRDIAFRSVVEFLCTFHQLQEGELISHIYALEDKDALRHLFRVGSSLESMVVGETQILGQIKDAYFKAKETGLSGKILAKVFEEAMRVGKKARSETKIGKGVVSISSAAIVLAKQIFGSLHDKKVLIIGAGKIAELAAANLYEKGVKTVLVANRTFMKAKELAALFAGEAITFEQIFEYLHDADILISSTSAPHHIIKYGRIKEIMLTRGQRALFLIDLGLPRNISPEVSGIENVHLYNIDDLTSVCDVNLKERLAEVHKVERIIQRRLELVTKEMQEFYPNFGLNTESWLELSKAR